MTVVLHWNVSVVIYWNVTVVIYCNVTVVIYWNMTFVLHCYVKVVLHWNKHKSPQADVTIRARSCNFGPSLALLQYFCKKQRLVRLHRYAGLSEPSLLTDVISTNILYGSYCESFEGQ